MNKEQIKLLYEKYKTDDYIFTDDDIVMCECRCSGEVNGR